VSVRWIPAVIIALFLVGFGPRGIAASDLSVRAGLGYEFLSQDFYEDSLQQAGGDSLAYLTTLKTTYLDDFRSQLSVRYAPDSGRLWDIEGRWEQTPDYIRLRSTAGCRPRLGKMAMDAVAQLERKAGYSDDADPTDDYLSGYGKVKLARPVSGKTSLRAQFRADFVRFDSSGAYSFNHLKFGSKLGMVTELADMSSLSVDLFYDARLVPDSSRLDYRTTGAEASCFGFYSRGDFELFTRFESKSYNRPDNTDDYRRLELEVRHLVRLKGSVFSRQEVEFEALDFRDSSSLSSDQHRLELTALLGVESLTWTASLGPRLEVLNEAQGEGEPAEDYVESGLKAVLDLTQVGTIFGSLDSELGYRDLRAGGALGGDFVFERLSLLANWEFSGAFSWNLLLSADWEWHEVSDENSRLVLLSTGLVYEF